MQRVQVLIIGGSPNDPEGFTRLVLENEHTVVVE